MKRYWLFMALLLAGLGGYAHVPAGNDDCQYLLDKSACSPGNPTETEIQVMQQAAPELDMSYQDLYDRFQNGEATIEQNEDGDWVVTVYVSGGGVLIAILNDVI